VRVLRPDEARHVPADLARRGLGANVGEGEVAAPALGAVEIEPGDPRAAGRELELGDGGADPDRLLRARREEEEIAELLLRAHAAEEGEVAAARREPEGRHALPDAPGRAARHGSEVEIRSAALVAGGEGD